MKELAILFSFTLFYYQIDNILTHCLYNKYEIFQEDIIVSNEVVQSINYFILYIFLIFITNLYAFSKIKNYTSFAFCLIYIKYLMDNIFNYNEIGVYQQDFRRAIMWLFTTPLLLKLYCDINKLTMIQINAQYHIISNFLYIILYPFRKTDYNLYIILSLSTFEIYFIYNLFHLKHIKYTMFIIYFWTIFTIINILEMMKLVSKYDIQIYYMLSDIIAKITTIIIVNDFEEQIFYIKNNIDIQSVSLLTEIKKTITNFEKNTTITSKCKMIMDLVEYKLSMFNPTDTTTLKLELLKKILPLELEDKYLTQNKEYKPYDFICVLFTDIVSYTELAKEYDADIIYKLLNEIYTRFDDIIKRYNNLQKIETIGDAYMVVSDIYTNDQTNNVKNMILFALDILQEVKKIPTPNNKPLQLRIGINLGKVVVGVLGVEIPRLCVIGNAVNVANRLQTNTEPDTIQISTHVYEIACETDFGVNVSFVKKENVFLKNLGSRTTYLISSE